MRGSGHTTEMARTDLGSIGAATEAEGTPKLDFRKRIPALDGLRESPYSVVSSYYHFRASGQKSPVPIAVPTLLERPGAN